MASQEQKIINVKDDKGAASDGVLHYTSYNPADRLGRAAIALVACLIAAGVTLFIPIAHFFLVPAFLIAGPVLFFLRYKQTDAKGNVDSRCPRCHESVVIELEATDKLPKWSFCPKCDCSLELSEK
ncbi:MAG: hypothetical protein OEW58_02035 [Gammaproteobacteria bacterium]|nr:hypothetical protein [Gammaproteobacteria bacterium]